MNSPKISIVTPSFNQGQYLEKTILSVLNQNYPNLEYIIIDGGSTDNSVEIIKKYEKHLTYWVSEKDNGQSHAINKGLQKCTGDIIAWINSDDYYEPTAFEQIVSVFSNNKNAGIVYGNCRLITVDESGNILNKQVVEPKGISTESLLKYWNSYFLPPQPSIFWLKKIQDKTSLLDVKLNYAMDMHFWLQLGSYGNFVKTNAILSNYLIHSKSKSGSEDGFLKFKNEWIQVSSFFMKDKPFLFKLNYALERFYKLHLKPPFKKIVKTALSSIVRVVKKLTGIKEFGFLKK